jgi:hypothetical protein
MGHEGRSLLGRRKTRGESSPFFFGEERGPAAGDSGKTRDDDIGISPSFEKKASVGCEALAAQLDHQTQGVFDGCALEERRRGGRALTQV